MSSFPFYRSHQIEVLKLAWSISTQGSLHWKTSLLYSPMKINSLWSPQQSLYEEMGSKAVSNFKHLKIQGRQPFPVSNTAMGLPPTFLDFCKQSTLLPNCSRVLAQARKHLHLPLSRHLFSPPTT